MAEDTGCQHDVVEYGNIYISIDRGSYTEPPIECSLVVWGGFCVDRGCADDLACLSAHQAMVFASGASGRIRAKAE